MTAAAVRAAFADQAKASAALGSPLTGEVCRLLGEHLQPDAGPVDDAVLGWPGEPSYRGDSVALRLAGGLHRLVLDGAAPGLAAAYRAGAVDWPVLREALDRHADALLDALTRPPQTNEVARSAAIIPAAHFALARLTAPLPVESIELGASAGLNLNWHRYRLDAGGVTLGPEASPLRLAPDWRGTLPERVEGAVLSAEGVDLHPVRRPEDLLAYVWPDQADRMARLRAAIEIAQRHQPTLAAADAGAWLAQRLAQPPVAGRLRFVFHTVARQYFPPATEAAVTSALQAAGAAARADSPLALFGMENDGGTDGAALTLSLWDGAAERRWTLGRADFHGRWVKWTPREDG